MEIDFEWLRNHYIKREASIAMRDGIRLYTAIYVPRDYTVAHPILLQRTPYGSGPVGSEYAEWLADANWHPYLRAGYILVFQDVRGKNNSQGEFVDVRPIVQHNTAYDTDETTDAYDTVEWLTRNTCNNGKVGVSGISYSGFYATMAMLCGHPAIKAVSPQAPITDWFLGDDAHHNGAFFLQGMASFTFWFHYQNAHSVPTEQDPKQVFDCDNAYESALRMGALKNYTDLMDGKVTMWNCAMDHPNYDDWWKERNPTFHFHDILPAVMVVGGLFDAEDLYGTLATYRAIKELSPETELYQVMGPWSHGGWANSATEYFGRIYLGYEATSHYYINEIEYPFFAYYLEGKGDKPVHSRVFRTGENKWMTYPNGWQTKERKPLYLHNDFTLSEDSFCQGHLVSYESDPGKPVPYSACTIGMIPPTYMVEDQRFLWGRPDVVDFSTEPMREPLRVSGPIDVDFTVSVATSDADFVVKLIDVYPDDAGDMAGYQMLVRADIMRGRYRNSMSHPEPFQPNVPTPLQFRLYNVAHTWLPGHRLMVQVQSSWFPLVDRNPQQFIDIYHCEDSDFVPTKISIHAPSRIWIWVESLSCQ